MTMVKLRFRRASAHTKEIKTKANTYQKDQHKNQYIPTRSTQKPIMPFYKKTT